MTQFTLPPETTTTTQKNTVKRQFLRYWTPSSKTQWSTWDKKKNEVSLIIAPAYCLEGISSLQDRGNPGSAWWTLWIKEMIWRGWGDQGSWDSQDRILERENSPVRELHRSEDGAHQVFRWVLIRADMWGNYPKPRKEASEINKGTFPELMYGGEGLVLVLISWSGKILVS